MLLSSWEHPSTACCMFRDLLCPPSQVTCASLLLSCPLGAAMPPLEGLGSGGTPGTQPVEIFCPWHHLQPHGKGRDVFSSCHSETLDSKQLHLCLGCPQKWCVGSGHCPSTR